MEKAIEREINGASCSTEQFLFDRSSTPISPEKTRESVEYTLYNLFSDVGPASESSSSSFESLSLSSFASDSFTFSTISTTESNSSSSEEYEEPTLTCSMCQYMPIDAKDIPTECIDYLIHKYYRLTKNSEDLEFTHLQSEKQPNRILENISFNIPYVSSDSEDSREIFEGDEFYTRSPKKQCFGPIGC